MSGRAPREKGDRFERSLTKIFQEAGFGAERIPLSGSAGGSYRGDVSAPLLGVDRVIECKSRRSGFASLYAWLEARDILIIKRDRSDPLVIVPLRLALEIASAAERGRA
jgi:Holliday junction resolvase